ncbi:hypothetical protein ED733_008760 [Metarhizium rileyi]|uniref:Uncharacterized protein n=1 Tax=Metarhizium rileyi (strain RCEF 4871) TaxID=1649241 RepID=A0A5C6GJN0_METRR|nr:hypothetical protein ED733_008760 [Metarhizium rileyi]
MSVHEICRIFGFPTSPVTLSNIDSVDEIELHVGQAIYEELLLGLNETQWFDTKSITWHLASYLATTAREATARDDLGLFAGDIFLISVLFSAKHTTALALEIIILREQVAPEQIFLLIKIYEMELQRRLYHLQDDPHEEHSDHTGHVLAKLLTALGSKATVLLQEKGGQGCLLLHHAAHYGLDSLCADINHENNARCTALWLAAAGNGNGHEAIIELLIERGADVEASAEADPC